MPVRLAIVDDYEVVIAGVARMLEPYADRIEVVELVANVEVAQPVDIALYDAFAHGQADHDDLQPVLDDRHVRRVVMYTWNFDDELIEVGRRRGLAGYLAKSIPADRLVDALERVHAGEFVASPPPPSRGRGTAPGDWPGRTFGLTERESEVLALITQGSSIQQAAETMHLSPNSVKSHAKSLYRKLDIHRRGEAILWGIDHGFRPERVRVRHPND